MKITGIKKAITRFYNTGDLGNVIPDTMSRYIRVIKQNDPSWLDDYPGVRDRLPPRAKFVKKNLRRPSTPKSDTSKAGTVYGESNRVESEDGTISTTLLFPDNCKTKEQLAEYCHIDLKEYYAAEIVTNRWNTSAKFVSWQFKVRWKPIYKNSDISPQAAIAELSRMLSDGAFTFPTDRLAQAHDESGLTLEIEIPDLHLGQLSWGAEVGAPGSGDYDIQIARVEYLKAIDYFIDKYRGRSIRKVILPLGSDFFNVNSALNTTANGTLQDEDTRGKKTFSYGVEIALDTVNRLLELGPVEIIQIPGNHDGEKIFYLMSTLYYAFLNNDDVEVDMSPADRKYRLVGNTLLGLTHGRTKGSSLKMASLPLIMADEVPDLWAKSKYREFHIGHLHHEKTVSAVSNDEFRGVQVRIIPSLSMIDYWHHASGFRSMRRSQCFEYDFEKGLVAITYYTAD